MIDRLSIEKKYYQEVAEKIDETGFMQLGKYQHVERIDLFMFALGLGIKAGVRTPIKTRLGFVQATAVEKNTEAIASIYSLWIQEAIRTNQEDKLDDRDSAFLFAEEYANTGFKMLADYLKEPDKHTVHSFIKEMDNIYKEYFPDKEV